MNKKLLNYFKNDDLAASVWLGKYAYRNEETPDDMHMRLANELARIELKFLNSENKLFLKQTYGSSILNKLEKNKNNYLPTFIYENYLKDFKYIVPQGSIMSMLGNNDQIGSLSNCFVIGQPSDSYGGIMRTEEEMVQLMKRRGGVGIDISTLRPKSVPTKNAAKTSTGAASFMERFSNGTREVAQDGRRGALMLTIDCRHPDVFEFVNAKKDRTKVTGANISVMLRNDFMEAVKKNEDYILRFPCDFSNLENHNEFLKDIPYNILTTIENDTVYIKKIKAKELYDSIVENAWENAEPGQIFIDKHWDYSPDGVYPQYKGVTTNP